VLLHGFLGSGKNLRSLALRWAERAPDRRFFVPDLPGHGASPPLPPDADLAGVGRWVLEAAAAAGLEGPLELVGHSLGGRVALAAAADAPGRVDRVVLLDITPGPVDPAVSESRQVLDVLLQAPDAAEDRRGLRAFFLEKGLSGPLADWLLMNLALEDGRYVWRFDRAALDRFHTAFNRVDLWPVVEARRISLRCVRGGRSRYLPEPDVARLEAAGCPVLTLPDAGHFVHVDALDALVDHLAAT
jgi:pimeloyl-ACP methyl ester carboxylesterase